MLDFPAQHYNCTTLPVMAVPRIVEIVMAPEATMCKTEYNGTKTDAAVEKLEPAVVAIPAHTVDCGLPGPHVVIPAPDKAERQA